MLVFIIVLLVVVCVLGFLTVSLAKESKIKKVKSNSKFLKLGKRFINILLWVMLLMIVISIFLPYKMLTVASGSMSYKNVNNSYLYENNLDNQLAVNDLVFVKEISSLDEIELYDIVCYRRYDGIKIIHRVIEIKEDYLVLRGDANEYSDNMAVELNDIVGVYTDYRIPKVGHFIMFLRSEYGILIIISLLYISIINDYFQKKSNS